MMQAINEFVALQRRISCAYKLSLQIDCERFNVRARLVAEPMSRVQRKHACECMIHQDTQVLGDALDDEVKRMLVTMEKTLCAP